MTILQLTRAPPPLHLASATSLLLTSSPRSFHRCHPVATQPSALKATLYCNRSMAHLKLENWELADADAQRGVVGRLEEELRLAVE